MESASATLFRSSQPGSTADPLGSTGVWYRSVVTFPSSCPPLDAGMGPLMVTTASLPPYWSARLVKKWPKVYFLQIWHVPKFQECVFLGNKTPCGVAPNIEEALRIYPNKINSFIQKSGKVGFPQKSRIWWKFTYQNSLFTENLNGPYGPYEPLLWDISQNKWPKNGVFDENSFFEKMTMSKILGNAVFGGKKAPAGCLHSKTKVLNIIFQ